MIKMKESHVMIDLETMGLNPSSAIVSIGAVIFDPRFNSVTDQQFYVELDWKNQNREINKDTTQWWRKQSKETKEALKGTISLEDALDDLSLWLPNNCKVWGNGPTFDITKLEDAYIQYDMEIPWNFWNIRDCRTIKDIYESARGGLSNQVGPIGSGAHNALNDAIYQATYVCKMWKSILGGK